MDLDPHYTNSKLAALYDFDSPWGEDTDFYLAIAGDTELVIADVGCGTGTLACGYAAAGHRVTGVDPAQAMLAIAKDKPLGGKVTWLNQNAASFSLLKPVDLITMTGHAFQVLLEDRDIEMALANFRVNLKPGGTLVFESRNPAIDWDKEWGTEQIFELESGPVRQVRSGFVREGEYVSFRHTFFFSDGELISDSKLRFASLEHIRALLEKNGFEVLELYGDWRGGAFQSSSKEMIFVARSH